MGSRNIKLHESLASSVLGSKAPNIDSNSGKMIESLELIVYFFGPGGFERGVQLISSHHSASRAK
jgi:hypothetical protein